jgi:gamma-glutamyltranspeptidase/glutathione hydrolase
MPPSLPIPGPRFARNAVLAVLVAASLAASACAPAPRETLPAPHRVGAEPVRAEHFMAAAANPLATEAGRDILARGGNAADAAIAMQMVLNLVEPQSSGIGGGGFLLYYDAATGLATAYDGRETAPAAAASGMFLQADGTPKDFLAAAVGGGAVGVPGLLAMLEMVHRDHGKLPWAELFAPAIRLARDGFPVSPRLHAMIAGDTHLKTFPETAAYFFHADGAPLQTGEILRNPALADALQTVADGGARAFYVGPIARDIVAAVRDAASNPGSLREADFAAYRATARCGVRHLPDMAHLRHAAAQLRRHHAA